MVELGKYANAVISAWVISLGLLALLIVVTWLQGRRAKRELAAAEARLAARKEARDD